MANLMQPFTVFCVATYFILFPFSSGSNIEQIHLSYGADPTQMVVTWVTQQSDETYARYGLDSMLNMSSVGNQEKFVDGGNESRVLYIHRAIMDKLIPGRKYSYIVGNANNWSPMFSFQAMKDGTDWSPRFIVFGDLGVENAMSLKNMQKDAFTGLVDAVLHVGDMGYDMDSDNARVGDKFMNMIQDIATVIPYMTCPGNHENAYNFTNYKYRFSMPKSGGDGRSMFYSFNIGPAHIVSFSSEFYYYLKYGAQQVVEQYEWLKRDLEEANLPENRAARPWIITMCHRPLYCSNSNDDEHCINPENFIRVGIPLLHFYGIESLLYKYGVDLHIQAHEHSYERMWPVYNLVVCNGSVAEPYRNPRAPVHIVTGSAGCKELVDPFLHYPHPWSAYHSDDYGYTRMHIANSTHLYLEQVSVEQEGQVIDKMTIIKDVHHAGMYDCHL